MNTNFINDGSLYEKDGNLYIGGTCCCGTTTTTESPTTTPAPVDFCDQCPSPSICYGTPHMNETTANEFCAAVPSMELCPNAGPATCLGIINPNPFNWIVQWCCEPPSTTTEPPEATTTEPPEATTTEPPANCQNYSFSLEANQITTVNMLSVTAGQTITTTHSGSTTDNVSGGSYVASPVSLEISFNGSPIASNSALNGWVAPSNGTIGFRHTSDDGDPNGAGNNAGTHYIDVEVCDPN